MAAANYLNHLQHIHADFLHANGEKGTAFLIQKLKITGAEKILEFGFGTGATLVKLKSRYPNLELSGIEKNKKMIGKCQSRIWFCRLKNKINLFHSDSKFEIPPSSIDIVYIESVLAILNEEDIAETLKYIRTILKPNGILAINESIWLTEITAAEIDSINKKCLEAFGILQCNSVFSSEEAAIKLIERFGFETTFNQRMRREDSISFYRKNYREWLSRIYTLLGKIRLMFDFKTIQSNRLFNSKMDNIFKGQHAYLSGVIMIFKKES